MEGWPAAIGRMNAIRLMKTMAGSRDADAASAVWQRPAILRMVFWVWAFVPFVQSMKEIRNVQRSFRRDRLGRASAQA
ncbi:MAG: hypothetical protein EWM45_02385 [Rhodopseudomonas palustris]|nr:MAG: hypothetical protein EWM45_02385 [Rhodopseudomonas palustris]